MRGKGGGTLKRQKRFFAFLLLAAIGNGGCSGSSGSEQLPPYQQVAPSASAIDFMGRGHAMKFTATALPEGFRPVAIMKDGAIPGSIGDHAAVFSDGRLRILKDDPECSIGEKSYGFINTATSVNRDGEVVGYCNYQGASQLVGLALYYKNGKAKALPSYDPHGYLVSSMSINDWGIIVGAVSISGATTSSLLRFYRDGTPATNFSWAFNWGYINTINDNNEVVNNQLGPYGCDCVATMTSITGNVTILFPEVSGRCGSQGNWINDRNDVVGGYACPTQQEQAFIYSGGVATYLPAPATEATGINDAGDIIGAEASGLFLYRNGILNSISPDITPQRPYTVFTNGCTGNCLEEPYLGGLSKHDEFIAAAGPRFYFVTPSNYSEKAAGKF